MNLSVKNLQSFYIHFVFNEPKTTQEIPISVLRQRKRNFQLQASFPHKTTSAAGAIASRSHGNPKNPSGFRALPNIVWTKWMANSFFAANLTLISEKCLRLLWYPFYLSQFLSIVRHLVRGDYWRSSDLIKVWLLATYPNSVLCKALWNCCYLAHSLSAVRMSGSETCLEDLMSRVYGERVQRGPVVIKDRWWPIDRWYFTSASPSYSASPAYCIQAQKPLRRPSSSYFQNWYGTMAACCLYQRKFAALTLVKSPALDCAWPTNIHPTTLINSPTLTR